MYDDYGGQKNTDKKTLMESLAHQSHEKGGFTGAWLYAEKGEIVSKGAVGFRDPADTLPIEVGKLVRQVRAS